MLKWARANGCFWDGTVCVDAAEGGHLEVLKWAYENGCEWLSYTCHQAARNGHLHVRISVVIFLETSLCMKHLFHVILPLCFSRCCSGHASTIVLGMFIHVQWQRSADIYMC